MMISTTVIGPRALLLSRWKKPSTGDIDSPPDFAKVLEDELATAESVVIALASSECFSFVRGREVSKHGKKRDKVLFDLEESIPVDADNMALGVLTSSSSNLLVVVDGTELAAIVNELEDNGIRVAAITPLVFLVLSNIFRSHPDSRASDLVVLESSEGVDLIRLEKGVPCEWFWLGIDPTTAVEIVGDSVRRENSTSITFVNSSLMAHETLNDDIEVTELEIAWKETIGLECSQIVRGRAKPIVDLRNGPLETAHQYQPILKSMIASLAGVFVLQICLIIAFSIRVEKVQQLTERSLDAQVDAFGRVFPDETAPVGITSRLQSEHRRLLGTRGVGGKPIPILKSALPATYAFVRGLPEHTDAKFEFNRVELEVDRIREAVGVARTYADQEIVAKKLRSAGLDVPQLSAAAVRGGVSLRLENVRFSDSSGDDR